TKDNFIYAIPTTLLVEADAGYQDRVNIMRIFGPRVVPRANGFAGLSACPLGVIFKAIPFCWRFLSNEIAPRYAVQRSLIIGKHSKANRLGVKQVVSFKASWL